MRKVISNLLIVVLLLAGNLPVFASNTVPLVYYTATHECYNIMDSVTRQSDGLLVVKGSETYVMALPSTGVDYLDVDSSLVPADFAPYHYLWLNSSFVRNPAFPEATPAPTATPEILPSPTATPTPETTTPEAIVVNNLAVKQMVVAPVVATATPVPTVAPTATPRPTVAPTATPVPTIAPTATPVPTPIVVVTPAPTVAPVATVIPSPTETPVATTEAALMMKTLAVTTDASIQSVNDVTDADVLNAAKAKATIIKKKSTPVVDETPADLKPSIRVNGKEISSDVPAQIVDGRMLVPVRFISNALGADVQWDAVNRKVVIAKDDLTITLTLDSKIVYANGVRIDDLTVAPQIINNRTFVPLRFISEALSCKVDWDPHTLVVSIQK
jgi:hypothetical protein